MSSSQNCRYLFMPEGNEGLSWVKAGNVMSVRVTLLCWLCAALGLVFLVEQPASGKFGLMPRWEYFCQKVCHVCRLQLVYCCFHQSFYSTLVFGVLLLCLVLFLALPISKPVNTNGVHNLGYLETSFGLILITVLVSWICCLRFSGNDYS